VLSAGLAGATLATAAVTFYGDRFGRRRSLVTLGALSTGGGLVVALSSDAALIAIAAFCGMLTGMGKDRGAMLALESATLPSSTDDAGRTRAFAWHAVLQDAGQALGGLLAALPTLLRDSGVAGEIGSYRVTILLYAALTAASVPWYATLSARADPADRAPAAAFAAQPLDPVEDLRALLDRRHRRRIPRLGFVFVLLFRVLRRDRDADRAALPRRQGDERGIAPRRRRGLRAGSGSSTRWCSLTSRRACC
jgi:MFS family permease